MIQNPGKFLISLLLNDNIDSTTVPVPIGLIFNCGRVISIFSTAEEGEFEKNANYSPLSQLIYI